MSRRGYWPRGFPSRSCEWIWEREEVFRVAFPQGRLQPRVDRSHRRVERHGAGGIVGHGRRLEHVGGYGEAGGHAGSADRVGPDGSWGSDASGAPRRLGPGGGPVNAGPWPTGCDAAGDAVGSGSDASVSPSGRGICSRQECGEGGGPYGPVDDVRQPGRLAHHSDLESSDAVPGAEWVDGHR